MNTKNKTVVKWVHVGGADQRLAPYIREADTGVGALAIAKVCGAGQAYRDNAALIAAAPELLDALKRLLYWNNASALMDDTESMMLYGDAMRDAKAIVAKAEPK